jgi:hypothetical protein
MVKPRLLRYLTHITRRRGHSSNIASINNGVSYGLAGVDVLLHLGVLYHNRPVNNHIRNAG